MSGSSPLGLDAGSWPGCDRWPAEWERHAATWLSWPHNKETWPSGLVAIEDAYCEIVRAIVPGEIVKINVEDAALAAHVRERLRASGVEVDGTVEFFSIPSNDAWVRDHGGIFVVEAEAGADAKGPHRRRKRLLDFAFDSWGGKYPPWDLDAAVARAMAQAAGVEVISSDIVLEASAIEGDGQGTILTTESCLLNPNRLRPGQDRSREGMEAILAESFGARRVLWLGEGIEGDDTDGHVDDLTRFIAPGRVVTCIEGDRSDPNFAPLAENRRRLKGFRDARDRLLEVIELPMPGRIQTAAHRLPASYANFYIANSAVLVPVFGVDADREALAILEDCFPGHVIVAIESRALIEGLGAVHCLTQQEPV